MSNIEWSEFEHLLGKLSDPALAALIGCHPNTVAYQRNARDIPAANKAIAPASPVKKQFVLDRAMVERIEQVDALRRERLGGGSTNYSYIVTQALERGLPLLRAELTPEAINGRT